MTNDEIELISKAHSMGKAEAEHRNPVFRRDLIELLQKHELPAAVAVARLRTFCDDILSHFNTRHISEYTEPTEVHYLSMINESKPETLDKQIGSNLHDNRKRHLSEG